MSKYRKHTHAQIQHTNKIMYARKFNKMYMGKTQGNDKSGR